MSIDSGVLTWHELIHWIAKESKCLRRLQVQRCSIDDDSDDDDMYDDDDDDCDSDAIMICMTSSLHT